MPRAASAALSTSDSVAARARTAARARRPKPLPSNAFWLCATGGWPSAVAARAAEPETCFGLQGCAHAEFFEPDDIIGKRLGARRAPAA